MTVMSVAGTDPVLTGDGDNGLAEKAKFSSADTLVFDPGNNLLVSDLERVRKLDALSKIVTTIAGNGKPGSGDGGPCLSAGFTSIRGMACSLSGDIFISDVMSQGESRIRRISASTGTIDTLVKLSANGLGTDAAGNLFAAGYDRVYRIAAGATKAETIAGAGTNTFQNGLPGSEVRLAKVYAVYAGRDGRVYAESGGLEDHGILYLLVPQFTSPYLQVASVRELIADTNTVRYQITVSNSPTWGDTSGPITVHIVPPAGVTLLSLSGDGWICKETDCQRADSLAGGGAFPPISMDVSIDDVTLNEVVVRFKVSGGGLIYDVWGSDLLRR